MNPTPICLPLQRLMLCSTIALASFASTASAQTEDPFAIDVLTETRVHEASHSRACSTTASFAYRACNFEIRDDYWLAKGNCVNLADQDLQQECQQEALNVLLESIGECSAQLVARRDLCQVLGELPYDPIINPANFIDPLTIGSTNAANPYLPLTPGVTHIYQGDGETVTVTVTEDTKEILGVTCIVVHDVVLDEDGEPIEDTFDWLAQDVAGNVWYFGEISRNFEDGELVDIEGSWEAGVEGAKPGILMFAMPQVGDTYRQEFALGEAEDMGEVISLNGSATTPAASCNNDCVVTRDFTPIEPGIDELKYYAPGIGFILETKEDERVELVEIQQN